MKQFLLFLGETYYSGGGWTDFAGSYDTVAEAVDEAAKASRDRYKAWWHVVDAKRGEVVEESP